MDDTASTPGPQVRYRAPELHEEHFTCPQCGVLTAQEWKRLHPQFSKEPSDYFRCKCAACHGESLWGSMGSCLWPSNQVGPEPHPEMPEQVRSRYDEARAVAAISPGAGGALLRVALEELVNHLDPPSTTRRLYDGIGDLVRKDLISSRAQQVADILRVNGNDGLHAGTINRQESPPDVALLFDLLNFVVDEGIARANRIEQLWQSVPEGKRQAVERRDSGMP